MVLNEEQITPEIRAEIALNEDVISNNPTENDSNWNWNTHNQNVHADLKK